MNIREARLSRRTKETNVEILIKLDGSGESKIQCENQFLRHMLETFSKYSSIDIDINITADNEHHLVEDAAILLGMGLREAIGKEPIDRISSATVPMDDALVTVSIDLIERAYADIECPDDVYRHFFRSFAMASRTTLHVLIHRGFDYHHIIEASFKALGMALKSALQRRKESLTTKGETEIRRG